MHKQAEQSKDSMTVNDDWIGQYQIDVEIGMNRQEENVECDEIEIMQLPEFGLAVDRKQK